MNIYEIHDMSNDAIISMLKTEFSLITNIDILKNYHPDFYNFPENIFFILKNGRYRPQHGKYYVVEDAGEYICSAGWNEYEVEPTIALLLTRMYVNIKHRAKYIAGNIILPLILDETLRYDRCWITSNKHNNAIYTWFNRIANGKGPALGSSCPEIYKQFIPIGLREVYYTQQDVVELKRNSIK
jgi:hypothetical protein